MAELTIEQKAKRYDEVIKELRDFYRDYDTVSRLIDVKEELANLIPELRNKENEDEKIRCALINHFKMQVDLSRTWNGLKIIDILAYLEKQGEQKQPITPQFKEGDIVKPKDGGHEPWQIMQVDILDKKYRFKDGYVIHFSQEDDYELVERKPADKVEPKFKVGDWVVDRNGTVQQILSYKNCIYKHTNGYSSKMFEDEWRMWNVAKDAKEGDVLVASDGTLFILAKKLGDAVTDHASLSKETKGLIISAGNFRYEVANVCRPATKEEIAIMQNKLDESGYYWDGKAKELVPIEENKGNNGGISPKFDIGDWVIDKQGIVHQISNIIKDEINHTYCYTIEGGGYFDENTEGVRLWTIADAENGDVLAYPDGSITMFNYMTENLYMAHVLWVDGHIEFNNSCVVSNIHPASKEQRDLLFAKMHAAGYEWDGKGITSIDKDCNAKKQNSAYEHKEVSEYDKDYKHRYKKNDLLLSANRERMYIVEGWDYNERNIPIYNIRQIGARTIFDWICEKADKELMPLNIKIDDWVVYQNEAFQVVKSSNSLILQGEKYQTHFLYTECRLWTVGDAKDGDVLYSLDSNRPFIYKERNGCEQVTAYCGLNIYGKFFVWGTKDCIITLDKYIPATEEQRNLLFARMAEAGYKWDAENKQLVANSAEPSKDDKELTEFETAVSEIVDLTQEKEKGLGNICNRLLSLARKQIAEETIKWAKTHTCMMKSVEELDEYLELLEKKIKNE